MNAAFKLVEDAIFYIGGFLTSDELVPARFVSKHRHVS